MGDSDVLSMFQQLRQKVENEFELKSESKFRSPTAIRRMSTELNLLSLKNGSGSRDLEEREKVLKSKLLKYEQSEKTVKPVPLSPKIRRTENLKVPSSPKHSREMEVESEDEETKLNQEKERIQLEQEKLEKKKKQVELQKKKREIASEKERIKRGKCGFVFLLFF